MESLITQAHWCYLHNYSKGWIQGLEMASDYNNILWFAEFFKGLSGSLLAF